MSLVEVAPCMSLFIRGKLYGLCLPAAEMIQACIGQSVVLQFCQPVAGRREVVGQSSVIGQELHLDVHAMGMRSVELERFSDQVVVPPHQLEIALQQMQQVKVPRDGVVERYFVGVIKAPHLTVAPQIVCGPQDEIDLGVLVRHPLQRGPEPGLRARVVDDQNRVIRGRGTYRPDSIQEVCRNAVPDYHMKHTLSACLSRITHFASRDRQPFRRRRFRQGTAGSESTMVASYVSPACHQPIGQTAALLVHASGMPKAA